MSSILKALKKVEAEKISRSDAPVDIARDILRHSGRRSGRGLPVFPLVVAAMVAAAGVFVLVLSGGGDDPRTVTSEVQEFTDARVEALQQPAGAEERPAEAHSGEKQLPGRDLPVKPSGILEGRRPASTVAPSGQNAPERLPALIVTGIAYQQDRGGRLAVVNELPVMEGTLIEGARIEEILEDRVRFVKNGRTFEVGLGNP